ncbi:hypothetical protein BGW38_001609 [Lunasporangiospora selenospora]|uniref:SAM domain-containing protein n=1 Tax=Lunasporangiospora selenospora TaxID=979761 RepID=A0A9P6KE50_9FUNG|nr:hypothetical protein BGW38_001609 [Lunasporangiospora selenospora]
MNYKVPNGKTQQHAPEEAIDKWFEDLSNYEQTLEDMAVVSLDHTFKEGLSTVEAWFRVLSEAERTAALYSLLQHSSQVQVRFFITVLQQMAKKDPVGALLSPTQEDKEMAQSQLHSSLAKAEQEASQRLLNVLPIQPPSTSSLDKPSAHRRLYDRHSVAVGDSEKYKRLFRLDTTSSRAATQEFSVANNNNSSDSNNSAGSLNNSILGSASGSFTEAIAAHVNQIKLSHTPTVSSSNVSTPSLSRMNGHNAFNNRPRSVCEGEALSMFSSSWNFATLGGNPLAASTGNDGPSPGSTVSSPGNIGDRTSLSRSKSIGRPKSVGGAEWLLSDKSWTPMLTSSAVGDFSGSSSGSGNSLGGVASSGYAGSSLAVERPKSITEADLAKFNIPQWSFGGGSSSNSSLVSGSNSSQNGGLESLKPNRRRTLRPSAIISNVPVTVMEGDEKLLSASANTSSINIVSSMFNDSPNSGHTMPSLTAALTAATSSHAGSSSLFSFSNSQSLQDQLSLQQGQPSFSTASNSLSTFSSLGFSQQQAVPNLSLQQPPINQYQPYQPGSRAQSPLSSPLPSPITSGFRSRPASRPTSPGLPPHSAGAYSMRSVWTPNGSNGTNGGGTGGSSNYNQVLGYSAGAVPMDYPQKRHLSPTGGHYHVQQPTQQQYYTPHYASHRGHHTPSTSSLGFDDDYLSDTSDMSSIGMNGHMYGHGHGHGHGHRHGRGGGGSIGSGHLKEKKQPEGVDFELLNDTSAWLRSLRLHKYNGIFEGMHWRDIVNLSEGDLINKGVAALGARRKMLKVFEQVRKEMLLQGMTV